MVAEAKQWTEGDREYTQDEISALRRWYIGGPELVRQLDAERAKVSRLEELMNDAASLMAEIDRLRAEMATLVRPCHDADHTVEFWNDGHAHAYVPSSILADVRQKLAEVTVELDLAKSALIDAEFRCEAATSDNDSLEKALDIRTEEDDRKLRELADATCEPWQGKSHEETVALVRAAAAERETAIALLAEAYQHIPRGTMLRNEVGDYVAKAKS